MKLSTTPLNQMTLEEIAAEIASLRAIIISTSIERHTPYEMNLQLDRLILLSTHIAECTIDEVIHITEIPQQSDHVDFTARSHHMPPTMGTQYGSDSSMFRAKVYNEPDSALINHMNLNDQ